MCSILFLFLFWDLFNNLLLLVSALIVKLGSIILDVELDPAKFDYISSV